MASVAQQTDKTISHYVEGPIGSGKTQYLVDQVWTLLGQVKTSEQILVLCSNYARKDHFLTCLQLQLGDSCTSQLPITTFSALVRNTLLMYWPWVEEALSKTSRQPGQSVIFPDLSGFGASEFILHQVYHQYVMQHDTAFEDFPGTSMQIVSQIVRRSRLKAENRLSRDDMKSRSLAIHEGWVTETDEVMAQFERSASWLRTLDNSRQLDAFFYLIEHVPQVQASFLSRVRYLVADDVDETTPAQQRFMAWLIPHMTTVMLAVDPQGGSRRGYLNAYPKGMLDLMALRTDWTHQRMERKDVLYSAAETLRCNWLSDEKNTFEVVPITWKANPMSRLGMISELMRHITETFSAEQPKKPGDMVLVVPKVDALSQWVIQSQCQQRGIPTQWLTGTHRPTDNPVVRGLMLLIQLANQHTWQWWLTGIECRFILRQVLHLHHLDPRGVERVIEHIRHHHGMSALGYPPNDIWTEITGLLAGEARQRFEQWLAWWAEVMNQPVTVQLYSALSTLIYPYLDDETPLGDVQEFIDSMSLQTLIQQWMPHVSETDAAKQWFMQVKQGRIADSPSKPSQIDETMLVIGTPQKIIDLECRRPIQLWLDVSSREWARNDVAPLYNAWVHSVHWRGELDDISEAFVHHLTCERAAHITRSLMLYATEAIWLFGSVLDDSGEPHVGLLPAQLGLTNAVTPSGLSRVKATLRDDQVGALSYEANKMAITAVPGAGKTFVNVELVLSLMERGIPADHILVLTYMDSAAKTLLGRLKGKLTQASHGAALPYVSTIHSLALRILTEDDHCARLGFEPDQLAVIDDVSRLSIAEGLLNQRFGFDDRPFQTPSLLRVIDKVKAYRWLPQHLQALWQARKDKTGLTKMQAFTQLYADYQHVLHQKAQLDFTDLIVQAVTLLETYPDIRERYQAQFKVIIEDEAQDSSILLQQLLTLLQAPNAANLIRTGDTNQSITTTFSTADTTVFREFIAECREQTSHKVVEMTYSGRCMPAVMTLANQLVVWASQDAVLKEAFQPIVMEGVLGKNPDPFNPARPIEARAFETSAQEIAWIIESIRVIRQSQPKASVAILLRFNNDCTHMLNALMEADIPAIMPSDGGVSLSVFLAITAMMQLLDNPRDVKALKTVIKECVQMDCLDLDGHENVILSALDDESLLDAALNPNTPTVVMQLYYHWQSLQPYTLANDMAGLIIRISDCLFSTPALRNVGYLCALKVQQWAQQFLQQPVSMELSVFDYVVQELQRYAKLKKVPFKSAQDVMTDPTMLVDDMRRFVTVMTLHKSKGMEFDAVFMPLMTEDRFPSSLAVVKWKDDDTLELQAESLAKGISWDEAKLAMAQKKQAKVEEEARLVYVGITRAQRALYLSAHEQSTLQRKKPEPKQIARLFEALRHQVATEVTPLSEEVLC